MNIKEAKEYIKQTVSLYLQKDEFGEYEIPVVRQRPVFLLGAPGVGKTAIMEQVAKELGIALVSYAMTHHTRQSALGLPVIKHKVYDGVETEVTEYTMSEIISTMYDTMEVSGIKEGILFLDEINCVSETLAPSMLQFLQYKEFGNHRIPDGWVVVTAGNPPEFNKSVREFDVVVMDRLKVLEVTPDYKVFREYAYEMGIHPAIINFLDLKKEYFYLIENTVKGRSYVTARGWEDLSSIILKYESAGFKVEESLVEQYLRNVKVVKEFTAYYDLYQKYKKDYGVNEILKGQYSEASVEKAKKAAFDERLSLLGMIMDRVLKDMKDCVVLTDCISKLQPVLKSLESEANLPERLHELSESNRKQLLNLTKAGSLSKDNEKSIHYSIRFMDEARKEIIENDGNYETVKARFNKSLAEIKEKASLTSSELSFAFDFISKAFEGGNEMLIFVTNLTVGAYAARFLARFPSEQYQRFHKELMIDNRTEDINNRIDSLLSE